MSGDDGATGSDDGTAGSDDARGEPRIEALDTQTVQRIAAGEVVERPASVVKELVENSLDADAARISVAVERGGKDGIRVRDDGEGMTGTELDLAVREHHTSKIGDIDDLEGGVGTLGFRGEALYAVGAVSTLTVRSCPRGGDVGHELTVDGGDVGEPTPAGCPEGTVVEVEDLFDNVPARKKFLKTDATEFDHVNTVVTQYALANPDVAMSLEHDGREVFATEGNGDLRSTVLSVYGREVAEAMVDVGWTADEAAADSPVQSVRGLVSHPETTRAGREYLSTFVNDRYVTASTLREAVLDAYGGQLASDRYPFAVLFVEVDPATVDVNVHPRKLEVRFDDEPGVRSAVEEAVREALLSAGLVRSSAPRGRSKADEATLSPGDDDQRDTAGNGADDEVVGGAGTRHEDASGVGDRDAATGRDRRTQASLDDAGTGSPTVSDTGPEATDDAGREPSADSETEPSGDTDTATASVDDGGSSTPPTGGSDGGTHESASRPGASDSGTGGGAADTGGSEAGSGDHERRPGDDAAGTDGSNARTGGEEVGPGGEPTDSGAVADERDWSVDLSGDADGGRPSPRSWQADDGLGHDEGGFDRTDGDTDHDDGATGEGADGGDAGTGSPDADQRPDSFAPATQRTLAGDEADAGGEFDSLPTMRVLGQLHDTYVVAETEQGLVLVDQHAADERVNYERLQREFADGMAAQALASPVEVELTAREAELFGSYADALESLGFEAERTGERTVSVRSVPAVFDAALDPELLRDVLGAFVADESEGGREAVDDVADELLADLACYPSVTGNTSLTEGSVAELLTALDDCENPYACPHGRPVVIELADEEIQDRFERDYPGHGGRRD